MRELREVTWRLKEVTWRLREVTRGLERLIEKFGRSFRARKRFFEGSERSPKQHNCITL